MSQPNLTSQRPYLLRAMHEWISDNGHTPHLIVDANVEGVQVPVAYVKDGKIVLDVSLSATHHLQMGNEWVEFDARFAGVPHRIRVPQRAVLGIYSKEAGQGMAFNENDMPPPEPPATTPSPTNEERRARFKVVK